MAEEVQIQGTSEIGKVRNPLGVIGLAIITLGIYSIVWYYKVNKELAAIGQAKGTKECGDNPTTSVIAVTLGAFIIVPPFVSAYNFCKRLAAAERVTGTPQGMEPGLLFVLYIFISPVASYIAQSNMNKVLEAQARGGA
jgi:drug/metabolite transporter (DMT)-like permease